MGVLNNANFRRFVYARFIANIAVQMQSVAVGWQVYSLTGNVLNLGLVGLAQFLPFVALVLIAGQIADRHDRRRILALCYSVELLCALLLVTYSVIKPSMVWPVFAVLALFGSARAFAMPAGQAMVINLVPQDHFGSAVAITSSLLHFSIVVGPLLGGLIYLAGPSAVYAVVALLLLISVVLLGDVRVESRTTTKRDGTSLRSLSEGLRFVWSRPEVLGALTLDLFAVLFGGATALLPAYARDVLLIGPVGLGALRMAPAIGASVTSIVLALRPIGRHVGAWMFGGVAIYGLATIVFGMSTSLPLSLMALIIMGAGDMVSVYIRHILVQVATPDAIRGRVSAVNAVFIGASNELGEFESGVTAKWFGLVPSVIVGGVATLLITGAGMSLFPSLRRMDRFPQPADANSTN
ncbi:MAG: MFS transporter [Gammaproteobacteria bacterium]